jgi:hypothetical protein
MVLSTVVPSRIVHMHTTEGHLGQSHLAVMSRFKRGLPHSSNTGRKETDRIS